MTKDPSGWNLLCSLLHSLRSSSLLVPFLLSCLLLIFSAQLISHFWDIMLFSSTIGLRKMDGWSRNHSLVRGPSPSHLRHQHSHDCHNEENTFPMGLRTRPSRRLSLLASSPRCFPNGIGWDRRSFDWYYSKAIPISSEWTETIGVFPGISGVYEETQKEISM